MRGQRFLRVLLAVMSVSLTLLCLEVAVRIHRGSLFQMQALNAPPRVGSGRMEYDTQLGWIPKHGTFGTDWISNVDEANLRSNGQSVTGKHAVLAVGDSFTFGDEVEDGETWPAQLEHILKARVANAGVGAYGIDQAMLRARVLMDKYDPDIVILSFISDDINRTEFSYYPYGRGWKPYFEYSNGSLQLRNVPVPRETIPAGSRKFQSLRRALSYSHLADAFLNRIVPEWWQDLPVIQQVHRDGENVSLELLLRLDRLVRERQGQLFVVALATNGKVGDNARVPKLVEQSKEKGLVVLDLSSETLKLSPSELEKRFRSNGHYSPEMNRWVAEQIAGLLREKAGEKFK